MSILLWIIITTFLISFVAFIGILTLFLKEKFLNKILLSLVAFSAGTLLGGAFFHLVPEAILRTEAKESSILNIFLFVTFGFCTLFVLENFIRWHHHHETQHLEVAPFSYLILFSDGIHNFIDGLIIAASFVVAPPVGIITALIVALHEIPQEIGDFGVLVYGGFAKSKALFLNFASATTVILGGIFGFLLSEKIGESTIFLLPFAAGNFIYIACSDLIPEIKKSWGEKKSFLNFFIFLSGVGLMLLVRFLGE